MKWGLAVLGCWAVAGPLALGAWGPGDGSATTASGADTGSPAAVVIATQRGERRVPVSQALGHPTLPVAHLEALLPVRDSLAGDWAVVTFAGQAYRFLLGAPVVAVDGRVHPVVGGAYVLRDSLFVPLQWLADFVPRRFQEAYRWDASAARFEEVRLAPVVVRDADETLAPNGLRIRPPSPRGRETGFRMAHKVVVDAGHGGVDPGNPGFFFPRGITEKDITLAIARRVRDELRARGVEVVMTRDRDTLVALGDRAPMCRQDCDLFVSIHVNSLPRRAGFQAVSGMETYFIGTRATEEAQRVAAMENEALRYESDYVPQPDDPLEFILKDLQSNEILRESARLAEMVQRKGAAVHPGPDRGAQQSHLFRVLRGATRPAILIETGFATNRTDAQFLASADGQRKLAAAVAEGIVAYLLQYERKILGPAAP